MKEIILGLIQNKMPLLRIAIENVFQKQGAVLLIALSERANGNQRQADDVFGETLHHFAARRTKAIVIERRTAARYRLLYAKVSRACLTTSDTAH